MKIASVDDKNKFAQIDCDDGENARDNADRIREAMLLVAYNVTTQEIGNTVAVTWVPWPDHKLKTDMTATEAIGVAITERGKSVAAFQETVKQTFTTRKAGR